MRFIGFFLIFIFGKEGYREVYFDKEGVGGK